MDNYSEILCGKKQPCRFLCRFLGWAAYSAKKKKA